MKLTAALIELDQKFFQHKIFKMNIINLFPTAILKNLIDRNFTDQELKDYIDELRLYRRSLQNQESHNLSQSIEYIQEYIDKLEKIYELENKPIMLEKLSSLGLHALNDAIEIKPNYPVVGFLEHGFNFSP